MVGGFDEAAEFGVGDVERDVAEAAFAGQHEAFRREVFQRGLDAVPDFVDRFQFVAALVDNPKREIALEFPVFPQIHEVVGEGAVLQRHLVDLHRGKGRDKVGVFGEVDAFAARVASANVESVAHVVA